MKTSQWQLTHQSTVGEVVEHITDSVGVFVQYFGPCFACTSFLKESLVNCAQENQVNVEEVLEALRRLEEANQGRKS